MRLPPSPKSEIKKRKHTNFVDMMISAVLHDLHYNLNWTLKSADVYYIGILKKYNKNLGMCNVFLRQFHFSLT